MHFQVLRSKLFFYTETLIFKVLIYNLFFFRLLLISYEEIYYKISNTNSVTLFLKNERKFVPKESNVFKSRVKRM